jgi:hypothetical protein
VLPVLGIILAVVSVFRAIMQALGTSLTILENGCSPEATKFAFLFESLAVAIGAIPKPGSVAISAFISFISGNALGSASAICKK